MRKNENSARVRIVVAFAATLLLCSWHSPAQAQVEYVKVCDAFGDGFYYIPGTDTCLKLGGYIDQKNLPPGVDAPQPPAGCTSCMQLDEEIAKWTEKYNSVVGKNLLSWEREYADNIQKFKALKATCENKCSAPPAQTTTENVKVCDTYGAGFFYIPGSDVCLKVSKYQYETKDVPKNAKAPPPPAGCQTCPVLDAEIKSLEAEYKALEGKSGDAVIAQRKELDAQITKLQGLRAGCQKVCTATPPRTAKKQTPGQYYKKEVPPLRTFTPPSRANPPARTHSPRDSAMQQGGG